MPSWSSSSSSGEHCYILQQEFYGRLVLQEDGGFLLLEECFGESSSSNRWYYRSSLIQFCVRWVGRVAYFSAVLDVSGPDLEALFHNGDLMLQVGGKFEGVTLPYEIQAVHDNTTIRVKAGVLPPKVALSVGKTWFAVMVMRTTAALQVYRSMTPRIPPDKYRKI
jgi:hypothetical protein